MGKTPRGRAQQLVAAVTPLWGAIIKGDVDIRRELLDLRCVEAVSTNGRQLRPGLPGLYLVSSAEHGDQVAFDLLSELGLTVDLERPKSPGGVAGNAARDFVVSILVTELMAEFPELSFGANTATNEGTSAVDLIRQAFEDAGLACIDYRAAPDQAPTPRSLEQAVRRFRGNSKYSDLLG